MFGEGMESCRFFEHRVFFHHSHLSVTSLSTYSERRGGAFGSLPSHPRCLLFLCNQRTGIGQSHIYPMVSSFRSLAPLAEL